MLARSEVTAVKDLLCFGGDGNAERACNFTFWSAEG